MGLNTQIIVVAPSLPLGRNSREEERVEEGWRAGQAGPRDFVAKPKSGKVVRKALLFKY